jgi:RHS repeat-associated protein
VTESGTTFYYAYDATDTLIWKGPAPDGSGSSAFSFDSLGQLISSQPSKPGSGVLHATAYAYDPAGHLTAITADGQTTSFAIDALGRHADQTVGTSPTTTYAYLGTSNTVSSSAVSGVVAYSAIDAIGDRLSTGSASAFGYILPDLHGNVVAVMTSGSGPSYTSAYRYDAYGQTCDLYTVKHHAITSPWRFQGRILESASGSTDLYDFTARSYDPSLGAFTSFDSVTGSAQNPLTLNRYLYAAANPATLVDPDGHMSRNYYPDAEWTRELPSNGTVHKKTNKDTPLPECSYERTTDCHGIDIDFSWINDETPATTSSDDSTTDDPVGDAMDEAATKAGEGSQWQLCSSMQGTAAGNCYVDAIRAELANMCHDAGGSGPACAAQAELTPNFMQQLPGGLQVLNMILLPASFEYAFLCMALCIEEVTLSRVVAGATETGEAAGGSEVAADLSTAATAARGGESVAAANGRNMHELFNRLLKQLNKEDSSFEPAATTGANRPDGFFNGNPIELKPNTPTGISAGLRQLRRYVTAFGKSEGYLYVYDAKGNITLLSVVTP